jgi:hypothetical protein
VALCGLPAFFEAAKYNRAMDVRALLLILSDVLAKLRTHVPLQGPTRALDMSDLINFAREVNIPATFEVGVETAKVEITSTRVVVSVLPKTWQRVKEGPDLEDRGASLARSLRRLLAKQEIEERAQSKAERGQQAPARGSTGSSSWRNCAELAAASC